MKKPTKQQEQIHLTLFDPPCAPKPEPRAVLEYGGVRVELTLTMVHHLINCRGWGNRDSAYSTYDDKLHEAFVEIERRMYALLGIDSDGNVIR